jgi:ribonuclease BN (tRNA processing enzyme)
MTAPNDGLVHSGRMRLTILGGCGAWPEPGGACSGYLLEHEGFRLLIDPGYATAPRLFELMAASDVDAVLVSHRHPDHCADLNPLLRARVMADRPPSALPVYAPTGALDAVLALDRPGFLDPAVEVHDLDAGVEAHVGPFTVQTRWLPHSVPNLGARISGGDRSMMYTGDSGPSPDVVALARGVDRMLAEATEPEVMPADLVGLLSTAVDAAVQATSAGVGRLVLTHLWPGTDPERAVAAAAPRYDGPISVARPGLSHDW